MELRNRTDAAPSASPTTKGAAGNASASPQGAVAEMGRKAEKQNTKPDTQNPTSQVATVRKAAAKPSPSAESIKKMNARTNRTIALIIAFAVFVNAGVAAYFYSSDASASANRPKPLPGSDQEFAQRLAAAGGPPGNKRTSPTHQHSSGNGEEKKEEGSSYRVTDEQWSALLAPHDGSSNAAASGRTAAGLVRTARLPHLIPMLSHRLRMSVDPSVVAGEDGADAAPALAPLVLTLGADIYSPKDTHNNADEAMAATAARSAARLSAVLARLSPLLKAYEVDGMEDTDAITAHYWPSLSASSASSSASSARPKSLPHDVVLLGEWAAVLADSLRESLGGLAKLSDKYEEEDAKNIPSSSLSASRTLPAVVSRGQQLLTLCAADADILPQYFLLTEDSARHAEALLTGAECLRALRDTVSGTVTNAETLSRALRTAEAEAAEGEELAPIDPFASANVTAAAPHAVLERALETLISDKKMTRTIVGTVLARYAAESLCAAAPPPSSSSLSADQPKQQQQRLLQQVEVCVARFSALAYPAGLNTKIGALYEEAIAIDSLFAPFRVLYLSHLTMGMRRCGDDVRDAISRELKASRITAAGTPRYYADWLEGLKGACRIAEEAGSDDAKPAKPIDVSAPALTGLVARFSREPPADVRKAFAAKGLKQPHSIIGAQEYQRFLSLARVM